MERRPSLVRDIQVVHGIDTNIVGSGCAKHAT